MFCLNFLCHFFKHSYLQTFLGLFLISFYLVLFYCFNIVGLDAFLDNLYCNFLTKLYFSIDNKAMFSLMVLFVFLFLCFNVMYSKNSMTSLLFLVLMYFFSGMVLIINKLEFFGLLYVIMYVGAMAVLFLFVMMMLKFEKFNSNNFQKKWTFFVLINNLFFSIVLLLFTLLYLYTWDADFLTFYSFFNKNYGFHSSLESSLNLSYNMYSDLYDLGFYFYTDYFYIFLMSGVILLISMVAPMALTFKSEPFKKLQDPSLQLKSNKSNSIVLKDFSD